jgi:glucose-1-phosphate adenylyltransferase
MSIEPLEVLVVVLAGGEGVRLWPLTEKRTKPAVPIGGKFRLIDIPLSNAFNSNLRQVLVLTQGKDKSLNRHIKNTWYSDPRSGTYVEVISPQQMGGEYKGDADAVRQIKDDIVFYDPEMVLILPGDHLLKMQCYNFMEFLKERDADAVIAMMPKPLEYAKDLGAIAVNKNDRIIDFMEKNPNTPLRNRKDKNSFDASMGIYAFKTDKLLEALALEGTGFGRDILPQLKDSMKLLGYDYLEHNIIPETIREEHNGFMEKVQVPNAPDAAYWRDVGSIGEYFEANMDLVSINPKFNLYGNWKFFTYEHNLGPAKFVNATNATVGEGSILSNVSARDHMISPEVYVDKSQLEETIIFHGSDIQRCNLKRTIVDKNVVLRNMEIGFDEKADRARNIYIDPASKIRVVLKGYDSTDESTWRTLKRE